MSTSIRRAVTRYAETHRDLVGRTDEWVARVTTLLDEAGINYLSVTGRAKSVASFAAKADRRVDGHRVHADPLAEITDQIGVRVITYVASDVAAVADLLADQLRVLDDRDLGRETAGAGRFGYASRHLLVSQDEDAQLYDRTRCASVQLRTVLQHAWAEFEHDVRYKGSVPAGLVADLDRRFTLAAGLIELADNEFSAIRERLRLTAQAESMVEPATGDDPRIPATELTAFLAGRYSTAGWSRTDRYQWIGGLLLELGVTSLDELSEMLQQIDSDQVTEAMGYRYPPGAVRRLDDDLLHHFGQRYVDLVGNAHRREALAARLARLTGLRDAQGLV